MSFDDGFMLGLMLGSDGDSDGGGGGGGDEDGWKLPESWPDIPEPGEKQIVMLIEILENSINAPTIAISAYDSSFRGEASIDWGDGYTDIMIEQNGRRYTHFYSKPGLYMITTDWSGTDRMNGINMNDSGSNIGYAWASGDILPGGGVYGDFSYPAKNNLIRAFKFGNGSYISKYLTGQNGFTGLVYVKYCGNSVETIGSRGLYHNSCYSLCKVDCEICPTEFKESTAFNNCFSLKEADFLKDMKHIPNSAFSSCYCLEKVDLSSAESIDSSAFSFCYSLKEINAPALVSVGTSFGSCYGLKKFSAPKLTELVENVFPNSFDLREIYTPSLMRVTKAALEKCYSLQKFTYAAGCNFYGYTFENNPALYPKPK